MTKLRFYFILCKDEATLLRADETGVTIMLHFGHAHCAPIKYANFSANSRIKDHF